LKGVKVEFVDEGPTRTTPSPSGLLCLCQSASLSRFGGTATSRSVCLRVANGLVFGACALAGPFLFFEHGALLGCCLAAAADGVVVVAVGVGEVAAGAVPGVAFGVFLVCAGPAVAVAPQRHPVHVAEAARKRFFSRGRRLLL